METVQHYRSILEQAKSLFVAKAKDYGTSWRILRLPSVTDQLYIKAKRIRSIQEKGQQLVEDSIEGDFIGLINYCFIGLMQLKLPPADEGSLELDSQKVEAHYKKELEKVYELFVRKNHDYGEAWRDMRITSMTDLILMKLLRIKQIENNSGKTTVSEGVAAGYSDIINYSVFCLIKLGEESHEDLANR